MEVSRVIVEETSEDLVALFVVLDGRLAVYVNARLTDESAAVTWAEREADAGEIFDVWWEDDQTS
jgi:hypothetical protein